MTAAVVASDRTPAVGGVPVVELLERCRFPPPGTEVDCAVSGGPDSTALLVLAVEAGLVATAWHVDHGLRSGSSAEGAMVARLAAGLGATARCVEAPVDDGPNLEARARDARRAVLPPGVLTGHTADDQAETVLVNLLRGAGVPGAAGIGSPERRPLLALRRRETRALCEDLGIQPLADPMNDDPRFVRNRIRHEVLPLLADVSGRDPVPLLARHAMRAAEATHLLSGLVADVDPTDVRALAELPDDLVRLALRGWLTRGADGLPPDSASVERVLDVARGRIRATEVVGGYRVVRSAGRLSHGHR
ncbi:MAG: tRNA lysidine(34) synthetase TilS [Acidimicrobiales bacterium]|nr:tRNA lysidine(34) synthetase TilS [Acidimicrobiales bacterium]MED5600623.1 tRNA lysidine(34) synthetase TilS [Actinomycetota bacterium]